MMRNAAHAAAGDARAACGTTGQSAAARARTAYPITTFASRN